MRAGGLRLHRYVTHGSGDDGISGFVLPVFDDNSGDDSDSDSDEAGTRMGQWLRVHTSPLRCIPCNSQESIAARTASRAEEQIHKILAGLDKTDSTIEQNASETRESARMLRSRLQQLQAANFKCSRYLHPLHTLAAEVSSRTVSVALCLAAATGSPSGQAPSLPLLRLAEEHARRTLLSLQVSQGHSVWAGVAAARLAIVLLSRRAHSDGARKRKRGQKHTSVDGNDGEIAVLFKQACVQLTAGLGSQHPATCTVQRYLQRIRS